MTLVCSVFGHSAGSVHHHNQGVDFALCHHCGCDLVRDDESVEWSAVPKGFRVIWREMGRANDARSVAARMRYAPPLRRHPRTGQAARPNAARPLAGTASLIGLFANLGELLRASEAAPDLETGEKAKQRVIHLPAAH